MLFLDDDDMLGCHTFKGIFSFKGISSRSGLLEVHVTLSVEMIHKHYGVPIYFGSEDASHLCHYPWSW